MKLPNGIHFFERGWLSANNILLVDATQAILIDTGYHTHAEQTLELVSLKLGNRSLTHILNTHLHSDHCGGNALLQQAFPRASTLTPPGLAQHVRDWDAHALSFAPTGQACPRFHLSEVLRAGQCFEVGHDLWQAHAAPGHDPHSFVFFNSQERILISADALWENGFGVVFPEIEGEDAFDVVASTLDVIESLEPRLILPGHGSAFSDVEGALARARSKLAMYAAAPEKHAMYAAKVLLKFKLLEFQRIDLTNFLEWASHTEYLLTLHKRYAASVGFTEWISELCTAMHKSGACKIEGGEILNA